MTQAAVKPIPEGMHTLTPYLICADAADAITFYAKAFKASEVVRLPGPKGEVLHATLKIGDSMLMLSEESADCGMPGPKSLKGSPVTIHLYVENVDATVAQAVDAGATLLMPATEMFWGDRYARLADPFGHQWSVATHTRDVGPEEMREAMRKMSSEMKK